VTDSNERSQVAIGRMRRFRQARGLSAQKLADLIAAQGLPITRSIIANMEGGTRAVMSVDELFAVADALGSTPEGILGRAPLCATCGDEPPAGFRCLNCGESGVQP
jgi:transcriptional regulator with XRE-family HTH domain